MFSDVSLMINKGDKVALIAKNGTGKSTFLRVLAGIESPEGEQASTLKKMRDNTLMPLDLQSYRMVMQHRDEVDKRFEELLDKDVAGFEVINLPQNVPFIQADTSRIARNGSNH